MEKRLSIVHLPSENSVEEIPNSVINYESLRGALSPSEYEALYESISHIALSMCLVDWTKKGFPTNREAENLDTLERIKSFIKKIESLLNLILSEKNTKELQDLISKEAEKAKVESRRILLEKRRILLEKIKQLHPDISNNQNLDDQQHLELLELKNLLQELRDLNKKPGNTNIDEIKETVLKDLILYTNDNGVEGVKKFIRNNPLARKMLELIKPEIDFFGIICKKPELVENFAKENNDKIRQSYDSAAQQERAETERNNQKIQTQRDDVVQGIIRVDEEIFNLDWCIKHLKNFIRSRDVSTHWIDVDFSDKINYKMTKEITLINEILDSCLLYKEEISSLESNYTNLYKELENLKNMFSGIEDTNKLVKLYIKIINSFSSWKLDISSLTTFEFYKYGIYEKTKSFPSDTKVNEKNITELINHGYLEKCAEKINYRTCFSDNDSQWNDKGNKDGVHYLLEKVTKINKTYISLKILSSIIKSVQEPMKIEEYIINIESMLEILTEYSKGRGELAKKASDLAPYILTVLELAKLKMVKKRASLELERSNIPKSKSTLSSQQIEKNIENLVDQFGQLLENIQITCNLVDHSSPQLVLSKFAPWKSLSELYQELKKISISE
jgi:hypothetical protein